LSIPDGILVDMKDMDALPDARLTVLSTGTQGEPMSALSLMAFGRHKYLKVKPGDVVVLSSRFIPGNERAIHQIINEFSRGGAQVMYEEISDVHVSGHASEEELRYLIRVVNPKCFIPVHGEYRHLLRHGEIAVEEGIPSERVLVAQDGDLIELSLEGPKVLEHIETGRVFVHGKGVGDLADDVLRDRRILSEVGVVTVVLVLDGTTGNLLAEPVTRSLGVTFEDVDTELSQVVSAVVKDRATVFDREDLHWWEEMKEEVRLAVRRHVNRLLGRKPLVQTIVIQR
jgi:ribonuclease J